MPQPFPLIIQVLCSVLFLAFLQSVSAEATHFTEDSQNINKFTIFIVACISALLVVFIISLCGGCTPMEVGSDMHTASSGRKSGNNYGGQYDSVATDVNTRVLSSGTTLPNDPYQPQDHGLPYALHPEGAFTANTFAGYTAPQMQPTAPQTNLQQQGGMQGAHMPVTQSEPPPPNYYQATGSQQPRNQPNQQPQSYGW